MNNCLQKKGVLVKCLAVLLIVLILVLIALFINLVIRKDDFICNHEHCIKTSAEIIRYLDQSSNPCEDFHSFSCGGFMKNLKELPPPDPHEEVNALISEIVRNNDSKAFVMQKFFYQSCVNLLAIEIDQDETILEYFAVLGYWPVLRGRNWNGTYFDWEDFMKRSRYFGLNFDWFLEFRVVEDNITRTHLLQIDVPRHLKPLTKQELKLRKNLLTEVAIFMGAPRDLAHYETSTVINFEDELGNITEKHRQRLREMNNAYPTKLKIDEIQLLWPNVKWLELINNVTGLHLLGHEIIIFDILDYVKDLNQLIYGTPKRIVADYMMWKMIEDMWQFLSPPIRSKFEQYKMDLKNETRSFYYNRPRFCIDESKRQFPLVAEGVYIRRHVSEAKRMLVRDMIYMIRKQYTRLFEDAFWMNRESRKRALTKLHEIKFLIGGPEEVYDEFGFADRLGLYGFAFKSRNIIDMLCDRRSRYFDKYYSIVNRRVMNNTVEHLARAVNISDFIIVQRNILVIPAAVLRDSFYSPLSPNYLNYGTLGKAIAQQIFEYIYKGNDSVVNDYDSSYFNNNWWVSDAFEESIKCLIKEASNLPMVSELKRPKKLKDNLAEFIAADVAYEAYKEWSKMQPQEYLLPALKLTPYQLFWIHTSKVSCSKGYTKYEGDDSRFKVIGPTRNSRYFARDFTCQEGTRMNPKRKCRIL